MTGPHVQVNDQRIRELGGKFDTWATEDLEPARTAASGISVTPGAFDDAETLRSTVATNAGDLATALRNLKDAFTAVGTELVEAAETYRTTENDNEVTANQFQPMRNQLDDTLPGFNASTGNA